MSDSSTSTSIAYILLSGMLVLAGFVVSAGLGLPPSSSLPVVILFFFGNAAAWTVLFVLGLRWYGRQALWLLLVAPFGFYQVFIFWIVFCLFGGNCWQR
jgi:hypothetical protein